MRIFLDTANIDEIREATRWGIERFLTDWQQFTRETSERRS